MNKLHFAIMCGAIMLPMTVAAAETTVFTEDFESYATTAALELSWTASQTNVVGFNNVAGQGAGGSSKWVTLQSGSAASLTKDLPTTFTVTDANPVNLTVYTRAANWSNSRAGTSIRDSGLATVILNLGSYNATTANVASPGTKVVARVTGWGGSPASSGYWTLTGSSALANNVWTKLEAHGGATSVSFEVNDVAMTADTIATTSAPTAAFAKARVGLGVSANQNVDVDSITVTTGVAGSAVSDWDLY